LRLEAAGVYYKNHPDILADDQRDLLPDFMALILLKREQFVKDQNALFGGK
jgi:hypothetical protein